jgi:signal recognition particle GTPase
MEVFSRDYIQASDEIYDESGKVIDNKPMEMDEDLNAILEYENGINNGRPAYAPAPVVNPNDQIIKKVFDKLTDILGETRKVEKRHQNRTYYPRVLKSENKDVH